MVLLEFFGKKMRNEEGLQSDLVKLKKDIESIEREEQMPIEEFDYMSWIESKIQGRSFADVVKEKLAK